MIEHGCYLPAPINGGPLDTAPPKIGEWAWQPKVDDWRAKLHVPSQTLWNQYGKLSTVAQQGKLNVALGWIALHAPKAVEWLDCGIMENRHDLMRGCIVVFDWIIGDARGCMSGHSAPLYVRRAVLESWLPNLPIDVPGLLDAISSTRDSWQSVWIQNTRPVTSLRRCRSLRGSSTASTNDQARMALTTRRRSIASRFGCCGNCSKT